MHRTFLAALFVFAALSSATEAAPLFSVDPASPAIGLVPTTASDILTDGPAVVIPDVALGLIPGDNLNALSFGKDQMPGPGGPLYFSVDRLTVGTPGSAVDAESLAMGAHGDIFTSVPGSFTNSLFRNESAIPLLPGFFGDDLDALSLVAAADGPYFSIDSLSASNGFGLDTLANDIFFGSLGTVFASGEFDMGLDPLDDIDALLLIDQGVRGVIDPGDKALFSLSSFSPTTFTGSGGAYAPGPIGAPIVPGTVSPADIFMTDFSGVSTLFAGAMSIGLFGTDELNALSNPEPGSLALLACGLGGFAIYRRRRNRQAAA